MSKFLFAIFVSVFTSCASLKTLDYKGFDGFQLESLSTAPNVNLNLHLYNPNPIGATLKNMDIALTVNNIIIGNIALEEKVRMKKHSDFVLPIEIGTSITQLGTLAKPGLEAIFSDKGIPFELSGELTLTKFWIFRKKFHFDYIDEVHLKEIKMN
ncbi:MAG: LEA type 2 family protein [Chitinophagales bacterium]